jgi:hypothetical protein
MARPQSQLHEILVALPGVTDAYFQPKTNDQLEYPCITYTRDDSFVSHADNLKYLLKKRYTVIVIDRNPDSAIPDLVESLPFTKFDRSYVSAGLNHYAFNLYF